MFNKEDIMARLMAGDTVDDIAQEITKALNDANAEYTAQKKEAAKLPYGKAILQAILDYMTTFHADSPITKELVAEGVTDTAARDAYEMLDQSVEMFDKFGKAFGELESIFAKAPAPATLKRDGVSVIQGSDAIAEFLAKHNL
jgi:hypothetical protein